MMGFRKLQGLHGSKAAMRDRIVIKPDSGSHGRLLRKLHGHRLCPFFSYSRHGHFACWPQATQSLTSNARKFQIMAISL